MGAPVGAGEAHAVGGGDLDAAVDDGDQVRVGDQVERVAGPGPVDAAKEHVAVERVGEAGGLDDAELVRLDDRIGGGGAAAQRALERLDL